MPWKNRDDYLFEQRWNKLSSREKDEKARKMFNQIQWFVLIAIIVFFVGFIIGFQTTLYKADLESFDEITYDLAESYCHESHQGRLIKVNKRVTPYNTKYTVVECEGGSRRFD